MGLRHRLAMGHGQWNGAGHGLRHVFLGLGHGLAMGNGLRNGLEHGLFRAWVRVRAWVVGSGIGWAMD